MKVLGFCLLVLLIAACVRDTDDDETAGPTSAAATTTGGETSCDDPSIPGGTPDVGRSPCKECLYCAINAKCADETAKCPTVVIGTSDLNVPCDVFIECIDACPDEDPEFDACAGDPQAPVAGTCIGDNPEGWDHYSALLSCIICSECRSNCDAANACT